MSLLNMAAFASQALSSALGGLAWLRSTRQCAQEGAVDCLASPGHAVDRLLAHLPLGLFAASAPAASDQPSSTAMNRSFIPATPSTLKHRRLPVNGCADLASPRIANELSDLLGSPPGMLRRQLPYDAVHLS